MSAEKEEPTSQLEEILKQSLEQCIALARKKIRSKKGIADLQNILRDYHEDIELATIILEVIRLIANYENARKEETEEFRDSVSIEEYAALESALQKSEASARELIRNQQQLKIFCEDLQSKNRELEGHNEELLKSTKQIILNLKREHQRLVEENSLLHRKLKEQSHDQKETEGKGREQALVKSVKKARQIMESQQSSLTSREGRSRGSGRPDSIRLSRNSLNSASINK